MFLRQNDSLVPLEWYPGRELRIERNFPSTGHQDRENGEIDDSTNEKRRRNVQEHAQAAEQYRDSKSL